MPNFGFTDFSQRRGSPFHNKAEAEMEEAGREITENIEVTSHIDKNRQTRSELLGKASKKSAEIAFNKAGDSDGVFTEVTTCGAFTAPDTSTNHVEVRKSPQKTLPAQHNSSKALLGFPSSANSIALDAKADLESDPNISKEVKEKVISKLFTLATMVQNVYESKVRVVSEYEKFKEKHLKDEVRREREQSEQLYKINMSFQAEVVQAIQQLKMDLGAARGIPKMLDPNSTQLTGMPNMVEKSDASTEKQNCSKDMPKLPDEKETIDLKEQLEEIEEK